MIKNKVEHTDGEFLVSILFASVAPVRAAIAEFVGAVSLRGLLFSGETTESALIPAPAAVLV
jgi:hypothetical protein